MKVLVVGLAMFSEMAGGSARYVSGMTTSLKAQGHDVEVLRSATSIDASRYVVPGMLGQIGRTIRRLLIFHPRVAAKVFRDRPDVVNIHFAFDGLGAVLAARATRTPIVVTFHGPWAREAEATQMRGQWPLSTRVRRFVERRVYRSAARCIVLSNAYRDVLASDYGVKPARIRVIPAGIDLSSYRDVIDRGSARRRLSLPEDGQVVVTVRRLVRRMGLDLLIEAMARLPTDQRPVLAIAGSGPEREELEALASKLGVHDDVRFLGRVPEEDLPALYAAGDLCVVPTRSLEGFGYVALEAYAAGTPVIATAVGGLVDLVGGFDRGALVVPEPGAISAAIGQALRRDAADRDACQAYAATFAWDRIGPRVLEVFRESTGV